MNNRPRSSSAWPSFIDGGIFLLAVLLLYSYLVTYGTGHFWERELRGEVFDSLAKHLLEGSAEVDESAIDWEAFVIDGKRYAYFGPFPALARFIPHEIAPKLYGLWSRASCLLAALLSVVALGFAIRAVIGDQPTKQQRRTAWIMWIAGAFCVPTVYLVSCARVYHEAVLWGFAASVLALPAVVELLFNRAVSWSALTWLSFWAGVALLSRITFGLPLYLIFVLLLGRAIFSPNHLGKGHKRFALLGTALPAFCAGCFQLWYNWARFGSIWKPIDYRYFYFQPETIGGEFSVLRIFDTVRAYFGVTWENFSRFPPFVVVSAPHYSYPELFMGWRETLLPLTLSSLPLLFLALRGFTSGFMSKRTWLARSVAGAFVLQWGIVLSFYFVTWRYATDLIPGILFLALVGLRNIGWSGFAAALTLLPSALMTVSATLSWHLFFATPGTDIPVSWWERIHQRVTMPPTLSVDPARRVPLSIIPERTVIGDPASVRFNLTHDGSPLSLYSRTYAVGVGLRFTGSFSLPKPRGAESLVGIIAIPDRAKTCMLSNSRLRISDQEGRVLFLSPPFTYSSDPLPLRVALGDQVTHLTVAQEDLDNRPDCDYLNLLDLSFVMGADPT